MFLISLLGLFYNFTPLMHIQQLFFIVRRLQTVGLNCSPKALHATSILGVFLVLQAPGRRSRTTSESSTHSGGRERSNSTIKQTSPPPPSIPEQPRKEEQKKERRDSPKKVCTCTKALLRCSSPVPCASHIRSFHSFAAEPSWWLDKKLAVERQERGSLAS